MTFQTSRSAILDSIETLINLIALCSHSQELLNTYVYDHKESTDAKKREELEGLIDIQYQILNDTIDMRRDLTSQIKLEFDSNEKMRCSFKHAIAMYGYSTELMAAYKNSEYKEFYEQYQQRAYELCMGVVGLFLGLDEIISCGRCISEILEQKKVEGLKKIGEHLNTNIPFNESTTIQISKLSGPTVTS